MKKSKEQRQQLAHNYYVTNLSIKISVMTDFLMKNHFADF